MWSRNGREQVEKWMILDWVKGRIYKAPMRCTLLFLLHLRNVLPFHQNKMPKRHQMVMSVAFVMIGVMKL